MLLIKKYVRLDLKIVRLPSPDPGFVSRLGWLGFFFGGGGQGGGRGGAEGHSRSHGHTTS